MKKRPVAIVVATSNTGKAREIAAEVLVRFGGIYLVTPIVRYEVTAELTSAIRSGCL